MFCCNQGLCYCQSSSIGESVDGLPKIFDEFRGLMSCKEALNNIRIISGLVLVHDVGSRKPALDREVKGSYYKQSGAQIVNLIILKENGNCKPEIHILLTVDSLEIGLFTPRKFSGAKEEKLLGGRCGSHVTIDWGCKAYDPHHESMSCHTQFLYDYPAELVMPRFRLMLWTGVIRGSTINQFPHFSCMGYCPSQAHVGESQPFIYGTQKPPA